ncbi:HAAS domain-containing protein [Lentibacillus sp. CBA3610]|uniref:HAAS signaling domain-containing protein n=1 Tax=Lentibacillus sp. CBA3610 TaxID=2518176 RepID=UPI00159623D7|nr:DUF1700 domain-containing protein [Lentibacillus sp. CBA3610]QKY71494.1 DUF1700 domain-containing protein [Lentibacillus sp. CBA3610]
MNKEQFLKSLEKELEKLPQAECEDILQDFGEHFDIGAEEGKTEEQIANSLGTPQQIAKELLAAYHLEKVEETTSTGNVLRAMWAVLGLSFFNLVVVLGPFLALALTIMGGWLTGLTFIVSPVMVLINTAFYPGTFEFLELFLSIAFSGLGLFIVIGMLFATRTLMNLFVRYLRYNVNLVKGGMRNEKY